MRYPEHKTYRFNHKEHWLASGHSLSKVAVQDGALMPEVHAAAMVAEYVTPVLVSPEGRHCRWMRADVNVDLPEGTSLEIDAAGATSAVLLTGPNIAWGPSALYRAEAVIRGRPLRFPLHEVPGTHLRMRIRFHVAGSELPRIRALRILYPNLSYMRYLPAIYHEQASGGSTVRRLLSLFEAEFGDLEAELADLPRRIDPKTAPDDWLPFLLSWLGLPPAPELTPKQHKALLQAAPELLRWRGTERALRRVLELLVGNAFSMTDRSAGPPPWTLPLPGRRAHRPRLGCDTLLLCEPRSGFRLGCDSRLGARRLGYDAFDPTAAFDRRGSEIEVRVAATIENRRLEPMLQRYLPYFIPAHCRFRLLFVPGAELLAKALRLGEMLAPQTDPPRLGYDTRIGSFKTSGPTSQGIILGRARFATGGLYFSQ